MSVLTLDVAQLDGTNGLRIFGAPTTHKMGLSVTGGKDINNDGISDICLSAPVSVLGNPSGFVYCIFGSSALPSSFPISNLNGQNGFIINGNLGTNVISQLGKSIRVVDDINGDNISDLFLDYNINDVSGISILRGLLVLYGSNTFTNNINAGSLINLSGPKAPISAINIAGDINHDGKKDIIYSSSSISAVSGGNTFNAAGEAYVMYNQKVNLPSTSSIYAHDGFTINRFIPNSSVGSSVSFAGDVNNDGIDDFIIGSRGNQFNAPRTGGVVYVVFGNPSLPSNPQTLLATFNLGTLNGNNGFMFNSTVSGILGPILVNAGISSSGGSDINSDGIDDIIFGAASGSGSAYVILGKQGNFPAIITPNDLNGQNGFVINSAISSETLGLSVAFADLNGDFRSDIIIGAPQTANIAVNASCYVVFGKNFYPSVIDLGNLGPTEGMRIIDTTFNANMGFSVSSAGDINNDTYEDIIIGSPVAAVIGGGSSAGNAYVIYGNPNYGKPIPTTGTTGTTSTTGIVTNPTSSSGVTSSLTSTLSGNTVGTSSSSSSSTTESSSSQTSVASSASSVDDSFILLPFKELSYLAEQIQSLFLNEVLKENYLQQITQEIFYLSELDA